MKNRIQGVVSTLYMTVLMGVTLSGIFTFRDGIDLEHFFSTWLNRFLSSYLIVLATVIVMRPIAFYLSGKTIDLFFKKEK